MLKLIVIGAGGFFGAVARYGLSAFVGRCFPCGFPFGTLAVNVAGCFLLGAVTHFADRSLIPDSAKVFLAIGVMGAFTTFSTFGHETIELMREGRMHFAFLNVAGNVLLGVGALWLARATLKAFAAA